MTRKETTPGQRFACDRPGCNKHYSRPDHLLRHKLNHDREKVLACDQCERTFVRQDLLARHLERHALRGKTLGRWSGKRKRDGLSIGSSQGLERDDDDEEDEEGYSEAGEQSFQDMATGMASSSHLHQPLVGRYDNNFAYTIPPPPPPAQYSDVNEMLSGANLHQIATPLRDNVTSIVPPLSYQVSDQQNPFQRQTQMQYDLPNYDPWQKSFTTSDPTLDRPVIGYESLAPNLPSSTHEGTALLASSVAGSSHFTFSNPQTGDYIADYDWLFDGTNPLMVSKRSDNVLSEASTGHNSLAFDNEFSKDSAILSNGNFTPASGQTGEEDGSDYDKGKDRQGGEAGALHDLAFFAILQREIPDEPAFDVDATVHSRLLHFLSSVQELPTSPLFAPSALRCYLHLFFAKLNTIYPLIHRPTFSAKIADPMLLSAMIVCGAHFADEAAHFLAERIGRKLWGAFISFEDFRPARATLPMLQAMLLTEVFGKTMGTRPQHETAHLFHNFIVTLARRNAVFSPSKVTLPTAIEDRWRAWSREEEKKRIALFSFLLDSQHAIIFRHIPALSSFQIHLQLPCDEEFWEAKNSQDWFKEFSKRRAEPPTFISALKASLSTEHGPSVAANNTDSFQEFILLHGLMSVSYDLQWKQQTLLAAPETSESISNWKDTLKASYISCKGRLDAGWYNTTSQTSRSIFRASQSLVLWAQIALHVDAVDIQIYAGLPTVLGRFIDHHTFSVARKSCKEWAKGEDARLAVWLAANFLKMTLLDDAEGDNNQSSHIGFDDLLHHQWVQYLCALVIWAYSQALLPPKSQRDPLSRPRSGDDDTTYSHSGATATGTAAAAAAAQPPQPPSSSSSSTMLQISGSHAALSKRVPRNTGSLEKANREASIYLHQVIESDPEDEEAFEPPHQYSTAVLELIEKICRGSRWELGREASGVLRKLIRERGTQSTASAASTEESPQSKVKVEDASL
ncbi:hypothetical protein CBS101457_001514 [Exobasidium rhododendri]|nr:hypothetical protein CBS101457_001514 [Exobasidium rhododendri]